MLVQFAQGNTASDAPPFPVVGRFHPRTDPYFSAALLLFSSFDADFFPVTLAGGDNDVAGTIFVQEPAVVQIPQVVDRRIFIDVAVASPKEITHVIQNRSVQ